MVFSIFGWTATNRAALFATHAFLFEAMADQDEAISGGYIILARKIVNSEIWEKPVSWRAIWTHILLKVNWKDTARMKMGQGYFSWPTERLLLKGVTEKQWANVLLWLKNKEMIKKHKSKLGCIITVCNYERYQDPSLYNKGTVKENKSKRKVNEKGTLIMKEGKKERSTPGLTPFAKIWQEVLGGEMPFGEAAKYLHPLVERHGQDKVAKHLKNYLIGSDPTYLTLARFSQTFGKWDKVMEKTEKLYGAALQAELNKGGTGKNVY